jgi:hypothetical protein
MITTMERIALIAVLGIFGVTLCVLGHPSGGISVSAAVYLGLTEWLDNRKSRG